MLRSIQFRVIGDPKPQGSKKGFIVGKRVVIVDDNKKELVPWRNSVRDAAKAALAEHGEGCLVGPVAVRAVFRMSMPKTRPAAVRAAGAAPCAVAPDLDKLQRALGDALSEAGVIENDARIARWEAVEVEVYQQWTGLVVQIRQMPDVIELPEWAQ